MTASFGSITSFLQHPFSSLAENPVSDNYAYSSAFLVGIAISFSVILGVFTAENRKNF